MKISELSDRSGLAVQTIKFYLREGLMPKGTVTGATRADYDERHLERLRLIRALREVGDLSVSAVRKIVDAMDDEDVVLHDLLGTVQYALGPHAVGADEDPHWPAARREVDALIAELGWTISADAPARRLLAQTFMALRKLDFPVSRDTLRPYIEAAMMLGEHEADRLSPDEPRTQAIHGMLVTTVLYEQILIGLHRLAQEDASARRFGRIAANGGKGMEKIRPR